jgi:hypothetical protein
MKQYSGQGYALSDLYLNPNNYRLIDDKHYTKVSASQITEPAIQKRTLNLISGNDNQQINELIYSFKQYGLLPIEWILVKKIAQQQYLVIEGDRRITALKQLEAQYDQGMDIGVLTPTIFADIPVIVTTDERCSYPLVKGFRHITANKKWPAMTQAKLINKLTQQHNISRLLSPKYSRSY